MAISRSTPTDDDGTGTTGTIWDAAYLASSVYDKVDALVGEWTNVTFSAGNFTASSGNWTLASGDQKRNRYAKINKQLFWSVRLDTTTVSATPATLLIAVPTGTFASTDDYAHVAYLNDNGTIREGVARPSDSTHMGIALSSGANFATATDTTYVAFQSCFELA